MAESTALLGSSRTRFSRVAALTWFWSGRELRIRYRRSVLSHLWGLITPLALLLVYGIVLTQGAHVTGDGVPYLTFAWTGTVLWTFFAGSVGAGVMSLQGAGDVITKVYFPREVLPLSVMLVAAAEAAAGVLLLIVLVAIQVGWVIGPSVVMVVPIMATLLLWTAAVTIFVSMLAVFFQDLVYAVRVMLQVGFFATPVMYPVSFLGSFAWIASVNPIAVVIESFRDVFLRGVWPDATLLFIQLAAGAVALAAVVAYLTRIEHRLADVL